MSVDDFQGCTAVVTGAATGIGFALAERFVADRARVALADIEEPALEKGGVGAGGPIAQLSTQDWEWVLGVNLWGVIHGLRAFLPSMLEHGESGHVVNTPSFAVRTRS